MKEWLKLARGGGVHRVVVSLAFCVFCTSVVATAAWTPPLTSTAPVSATATTSRPYATIPCLARKNQVLFASTTTGINTAPADERYYSYVEAPLPTQSAQSIRKQRITLTRYLDQLVQGNQDLQEMASLLMAVQMACRTISNLVNRAGLVQPGDDRATEEDEDDGEDERDAASSSAQLSSSPSSSSTSFADGRYYSMQRLDQLSTAVLKNALQYTGKCAVHLPRRDTTGDKVADHQPGVLLAKSLDSQLVACLDPLDGSGNADASICTGTVFGVFETAQTENEEDWMAEVLQPAQNMKAAGYCLYSSATVLVFTLGDTVQGFTLDPQTQEFVLTHRNLTIPKRGNVYSCNEAYRQGWDQGVRDYIQNIQAGRGQTQQRYALRYVGSMVGDIHRTLLYGGLFLYPSDRDAHPRGNLQLLYKTAPMAFIVHTAGGKALDEKGDNLLTRRPDEVNMKSPCFLGSPEDLDELRSYLVEPLAR